MTSDWLQLAYLLAAGAVVLLGSRWELRRVAWGETAWRLMLVVFAAVVVIAVVLLARRESAPPPPPVVVPSGDAVVM